MSNPTPTPKIGPAAIAEPSFAGGPGFALSTADWLAIQIYVIDALALPTTNDAFAKSLGSGAPSDLSDFQQLIAAYATINSHVSSWQNDTFPASVSLASDVYNYAQQAPTYYNPILPLAQALTQNPNDQTAKDELTAILNLLSKSASDNQAKATAVHAKIQTFAQQTQADKVALSGTDGKGGLVKDLNDKYGATSTEVQDLIKDIQAQKIILDAANSEYNQDVIIASTTPTYAWVPFVGIIAAGIVAGIYGDKAVKALERVHAAQDKIDGFQAKMAADALLLIAVNRAESGLSNIVGPLAAALPIIQKIQGVWGAIADDLNNIVGVIQTNIAQALPIIMNLGVQTAIDDWTAVGAEANAYRINAYVTVQP